MHFSCKTVYGNACYGNDQLGNIINMETRLLILKRVLSLEQNT